MIILTGRFQPFHLGHVELINKLLSEYPDDIICLGIIRDCHISNDKDEFDEKADEQLNTTKNPYDSEILMRMAQEIVKLTNDKRVVYTLMPRTSMYTWELIKDIFGKDNERIWVIPQVEGKFGEWENAKASLYLRLNEKVKRIRVDKNISASDVRKKIADRDIEGLKELVPSAIADIIMIQHGYIYNNNEKEKNNTL